MSIRTIVLDFDGTCTDVEQEAQGFLAGYKADLARLLDLQDVETIWAEKEAEVLAAPHRHGMVIGGRIVAPPVDLYLLATAISTLIEPDLPDAETERLFKEHYQATTTAFKPETRQAVEALIRHPAPLYVVTNSEAGKVGGKLDELAPEGRETIRLHGNARKFHVGPPDRHAGHPRFEALPEQFQVAGWRRPVQPRRGSYFDALQSIWEETGASPAETLVIGDVFELDLLLAGALGCRVHLVPSPRTLDYERAGVEAFGGTHDPDLRRVASLL